MAGDEVRDAIGDDTRLAATRSGEHEQRSLGVGDGAGLRLVQVGQRSGVLGSALDGFLFHGVVASTNTRLRQSSSDRAHLYANHTG